MDSERKYSFNGDFSAPGDAEDEWVSAEQLQRLVRLLDQSDVTEVELKRPQTGLHLVLRKAKAPPGDGEQNEHRVILPATVNISETVQQPQTEHRVVAPLVGVFHTWAKPKGGALVAVGDHVKAGQLVATIQSLNVLNEVEASATGRVTAILVQDGQPVEYGQHLMTIDSKEGA